MSWVIGIVVVAILVIIALLYYTYPPLMHRHQIAHEMAGFAGRSWGPSDIITMFWNTEILEITPVVSSGVEYDKVHFRIDNPGYGISNWDVVTFFNKSKKKYEGYCASDSGVREQMSVLARAMGCDRAQEIGKEIVANPLTK
jgi:hypothetical protein